MKKKRKTKKKNLLVPSNLRSNFKSAYADKKEKKVSAFDQKKPRKGSSSEGLVITENLTRKRNISQTVLEKSKLQKTFFSEKNQYLRNLTIDSQNTGKLEKTAFSSAFSSALSLSAPCSSSSFLRVSEEKEKGKSYARLKSHYKVSTEFFVPDFLNGQKQSFKNFLTYGLIQELNLYGWFSMRLEDISLYWSFENDDNEFLKQPLDNSIDIIFHGEHYKLTKPKLSPRKAILSRQTYSSQLYVPIQINLHWTKEVFVYWFLLANLPMMTKKGHFIINGISRVILNQIIRRPGIYFKIVEKNKSSNYVADIIAQRGTWLRLEIVSDRTNPSKGKIWAKLKKLKKFSVSLLLSDLGLNQAFFDHYLKSRGLISRFAKDAIFQNTFSDKSEKIEQYLLSIPKKQWVAILNSKEGFFRKKFSNAYAYSLSQSGRQNLNQTLGLNLPINHITLTGEDVLLGCCQLIDFFHGAQKPSDIDDLKNRKLRPTGELIQHQIGVGLLQLRENVINTLNKKTDEDGILWETRKKKHDSHKKKAYFQRLISNAPVNATLQSFFATNPLSQFLDQTNALSELTHKRRISSLGEGGIQRETATMAVRGIHPSHYGRICPIETPEGKNAGLVNSFTAYSKLNSLGLIETPFYRVYKGMVVKEGATMFSSEQEKNFTIAPGDISMTKDHCLFSKKQVVRQVDRFNLLLPDQIHFMATGPLQMISIATSLIPFLEHDDGNRALMGSNMQRQAVPTLVAKSPIVGTGFESRVLSDSCVGIQAKSSGIVSYVDNQRVILCSPCLTNLRKLPQMLKTKFKLTHLTPNKLKFKSLKVQEQIHGLIKQMLPLPSKVDLFGHNNKNNQINLNQMQLYRHFDLRHHHAYFSLWLIFSNIAKHSIIKQNAFNPVITQTALALLQQTYNADYFNHYCILLLHQMFYASKKVTLASWSQWLKAEDLGTVAFMGPKTKSNQSSKIILKNKIKPSYEIIKNLNTTPDIKTKTILTPYVKGPTKERLKAILKDQSKVVPWLSLIKSPSLFFHLNKTLKIVWSSNLLKSNINKMVKKDLEADAFTKTVFSNALNPMFYMPLFEPTLKSQFQSKPNHLNRVPVPDSRYKRKQNLANGFKLTNLNFNLTTTSSKLVLSNQYNLTPHFRSNQDTPLAQKPVVSEGQWVEKGDALADNRSSLNGELAIGQNLLVGYTPWEGYNFEDAVLLNQRVISENLLTTIHIERYEININDTPYGPEFIPLDDPEQDQKQFYYLDAGIIKVGTWVEENMILVRKHTPIETPMISTYEKLAHKVLQTSEPIIRDTSICVPANVHGRVIHVEIINEFKEKKTLKQKKNLRSKKVQNQKLNLLSTRRCFRKQSLQKQKNLQLELQEKADKIANLNLVSSCCEINETFWLEIEKEIEFLGKKSVQTLKRIKKFSKIKTFGQKVQNRIRSKPSLKLKSTVKKVEVYIAEQRKVQVGDKIAGRHGNKGIISAILPREDMPYLPDGSVLDVVLNPLGVPSRMNVGQIFECLLGLAGSYLNQVYKIQPFDETYGIEASRSLVYSKLYEARLKTNQSWLFNPNYPGKVRLFDGRTGQCFAQPVTVGKAYILKLIHLVDEKIHARSTGPYSIVTQQPLRGRSKQGGQRVGEMEVWAFEGFGAAYILQELLTIKSDDIENRKYIDGDILCNNPFVYGIPESFNVLKNELRCLCVQMVMQYHPEKPLLYKENERYYDQPLLPLLYEKDYDELENLTAILKSPSEHWPFNDQ